MLDLDGFPPSALLQQILAEVLAGLLVKAAAETLGLGQLERSSEIEIRIE